MYVRFFFFLGENSVNYLPEDSFVFFLLAEQSGATCSASELSSVRKKIHESVDTRECGTEKNNKSSRRKRGRMVLSARACARYMTD